MDPFLPPWPHLFLVIVFCVVLVLIGEYVGDKHRQVGQGLMMLGAIGAGIVLFVRYPYGQAFLLLVVGANVFFTVWQWFDGKEKYREIKEGVKRKALTEIPLPRRLARLALDVLLVGLVTAGMVLAVWFLPQEQSALVIVNLFILIHFYGQLVERIITFYSTRLYMDEKEGVLYLLSWTKPKQLPLKEMEEIHLESKPDLLKLNPFFMVFTTHQDYTSHFGQVLCLTFSDETIYFTPQDPHYWHRRLSQFWGGQKQDNLIVRTTLPVWHPTVLKRLAGKLYYAVTVKGISAYSALILVLYKLQLPWWGISIIIGLWWGINLILSDKVLKAALDAKPIQAGAVYELAQKVFQRAGLNRVRLYTTEANEYNGLAIGMTIGRSMVVLTSATLKLPPDAIEGILAHEAVHVKKRDVLTGQLLRILGIVVLVGLVYINVDTLQALADKKWLLVPVFMVIPWLYAVYLSFTQQWMEVRADHAGSAFLEGGKEQMAQALRLLTLQQEQALAKNLRYSLTDQEREKREKKMTSQLERDTWGWRFLEFQLQAHPPMYWRIKTLETVDQPWGWSLFKRWWVDRWRESLPD